MIQILLLLYFVVSAHGSCFDIDFFKWVTCQCDFIVRRIHSRGCGGKVARSYLPTTNTNHLVWGVTFRAYNGFFAPRLENRLIGVSQWIGSYSCCGCCGTALAHEWHWLAAGFSYQSGAGRVQGGYRALDNGDEYNCYCYESYDLYTGGILSNSTANQWHTIAMHSDTTTYNLKPNVWLYLDGVLQADNSGEYDDMGSTHVLIPSGKDLFLGCNNINSTFNAYTDIRRVWVCDHYDASYFTPPPTSPPSPSPTQVPTPLPTSVPTKYPTKQPTANPTKFPTRQPTQLPTQFPTPFPTDNPTSLPTAFPSRLPTIGPTFSPSQFPSVAPSVAPSLQPSASPTQSPTGANGVNPINDPTIKDEVQSSGVKGNFVEENFALFIALCGMGVLLIIVFVLIALLGHRGKKGHKNKKRSGDSADGEGGSGGARRRRSGVRSRNRSKRASANYASTNALTSSTGLYGTTGLEPAVGGYVNIDSTAGNGGGGAPAAYINASMEAATAACVQSPPPSGKGIGDYGTLSTSKSGSSGYVNVTDTTSAAPPGPPKNTYGSIDSSNGYTTVPKPSSFDK